MHLLYDLFLTTFLCLIIIIIFSFKIPFCSSSYFLLKYSLYSSIGKNAFLLYNKYLFFIASSIKSFIFFRVKLMSKSKFDVHIIINSFPGLYNSSFVNLGQRYLSVNSLIGICSAVNRRFDLFI